MADVEGPGAAALPAAICRARIGWIAFPNRQVEPGPGRGRRKTDGTALEGCVTTGGDV